MADLGTDFPASSRAEWMAGVRGVLTRGRPDATDAEVAEAFVRQLVTTTEDGIELQPLYDADDAPPAQAEPGRAPFVRGTHADPRPWEIRQRVWADVDGSRATTELEAGATGLLLEIGAEVGVDELDELLDGVFLDLAPVSLATPAHDDGAAAARALIGLWDRRQVAVADRTGTLGIDPYGAWMRTGGVTDHDAALAAAAAVVGDLSEAAPRARGVVVDGTVWHDAGASDGQELAWTIAAAAATVRGLVGAGVGLEQAFTTLEFRWAATADQFATICKLRAARRLWSRVAELSGASPASGRMFQHVDASRSMMTRYDPWVNTLRSTVGCFAAAVGGADAVTVSPHDVLIVDGGSVLGRRIARNTQSVLQLESNLSRVVDPAGGSWYVERRTHDLADLAWNEVRRIEAAGGLVAAVRDGLAHEAIAGTLAVRRRAVATRRRALTGLSEFPDVAETPPPPVASPADAGDTEFAPFTLRRVAGEFEAQRGRVDALERSGGDRPVVYLAMIGGPAVATTRATFAKNLFEVAGIHTVQGDADGYDPTVSTVVCLCSSDAGYRESGADVAQRLRAAGAETVFLAGRNLDVDGVDEEVGAGSDVLDFLTRTLDRMGVPA